MLTILAVDDDPNILELVRITLSAAGYSVMKAKNGREALELMEHEVPDLAVVDVMMPEMDGYELTKKCVLNGIYQYFCSLQKVN